MSNYDPKQEKLIKGKADQTLEQRVETLQKRVRKMGSSPTDQTTRRSGTQHP